MSRTKSHVATTINGDAVEFLCEPQQTLLDVLRDELHLTGSKEGCASGDCGACSVTLDGRLVCACLVLAVETSGHSVETIEAMADEGAARQGTGSYRDSGSILAGRQSLPLHRLRQDRTCRTGRGR